MIERNPSPYGFRWRWRREPPPAVRFSDMAVDVMVIIRSLFSSPTPACRYSVIDDEPTHCAGCLNLTRSLVMKNPVQRLCVECLADKTETVGGIFNGRCGHTGWSE